MKMTKLDVLGTGTAVFERGEVPEILFLHGNPDTHHVWSPVIERLAAKHRCIAPDLPPPGPGPLVWRASSDVSARRAQDEHAFVHVHDARVLGELHDR